MSWIQIKKAIGIKVMVVKLHYSLFYGDRARTLVAQILYFFSLASFSPFAKSKNECKAHQIHGRFGRFALPLIQFLEGWKWNPAMYWALDCGRRAGDRRWTAERPPPPPPDRAATNVGCPGKLPPIWGGPRARPPMWGGARVRSPARKRRGRGH